MSGSLVIEELNLKNSEYFEENYFKRREQNGKVNGVIHTSFAYKKKTAITNTIVFTVRIRTLCIKASIQDFEEIMKKFETEKGLNSKNITFRTKNNITNCEREIIHGGLMSPDQVKFTAYNSSFIEISYQCGEIPKSGIYSDSNIQRVINVVSRYFTHYGNVALVDTPMWRYEIPKLTEEDRTEMLEQCKKDVSFLEGIIPKFVGIDKNFQDYNEEKSICSRKGPIIDIVYKMKVDWQLEKHKLKQ